MEKLFYLFQKYKLILSNDIYEYLTSQNFTMDHIENILRQYDGREELFIYIKTYSTENMITITVNSDIRVDGEAIYIHPIGFNMKNEKYVVQYEDFNSLFKKHGRMERVFEYLYEKYKTHRFAVLYGLIYKTRYKNLIFINELESGEFQYKIIK